MYHLFLDDERKPGHVTWVNLPSASYEVVRNFYEFVNIIEQRGIPEFVSFDHDLGEEHYKQMMYDMQKNSSGQMLFEIADVIEDHDYGETPTGYDCAKWLVQHCIAYDLRFPEYAVHSMNPIGAERIKTYIQWSKTHFDFL